MRAIVLYESMFGNTQQVARAIADGLSERLNVEVIEVGSAAGRLTQDVGLLVAGAPTHAFGLSRPQTRASAAQQTTDSLVSRADGLREWLASAERPAKPVAAATFDTRIAKPKLPGSAARAAARRLHGLGFTLIADPASFYVGGSRGPLSEGELERARKWGAELGRTFATRAGVVH
ncbi:flavodoxin family protein [Streptosporangiaceae bacterium NEAU-GS5]|nr:flavodoxin family protein [Streptosporangiaceae bacterium NEAU-GS5]